MAGNLRAEDVEFTEVADAEELQSGIPKSRALTIPDGTKVPSGVSKSLTQNKEVMERIQEDIALNLSLGLNSQSKIQINEVVENEIEKLTSDSYPEIDERGLRKLFGVSAFRPALLLHNFVQLLKNLVVVAMIPSFVVVVRHVFPFLGNVIETSGLFLACVGILGTALAAVGVVFSVLYWIASVPSMVSAQAKDNPCGWPTWLQARYLLLDIKIELASETSIKIPYGVKLKMKEAKDKNIFSGFVVAYPQIVSPEFKMFSRLKANFVDPALMGVNRVNGERVMHLISYWDIEKDKERILNDMKRMKKLKTH